MKRGPNEIRTGFTLIELVLTVAVLAILVSIVIPRIGWGTMGKVQAETAARQFSNYLKLARSLAITHASSNSEGYKVVLSPSQPYTYSLINAGTSETVKGPIDIPEGVTCSGASEFHFTPLGELQDGGTLTLQFSKSGDTTVVSVTPIGRITVQ
jgi:prepilin-type N-terminal cleavage/methylation domain-containing protein